MTYFLGRLSEERLNGVDERLQRCVRRSITESTVDFSVVEGLRSEERQRQLYRDRASRTLDSYHLTGHAVDLAPYIGGQLCWHLLPMLQVVIAMRSAALTFQVPMVWGGVWDRRLDELAPSKLEDEIEAYKVRYRAARGFSKHPLLDAWHFQVDR